MFNSSGFEQGGSGSLIVLCPGNFKSQILIQSIQDLSLKQQQPKQEHSAHQHHAHHHHHHDMQQAQPQQPSEMAHAHHANQVDATETCVLAAAFAIDSSAFTFEFLYQFALIIQQRFAQYQRDILRIAFSRPLTRAPPFFSLL